MAGEGDLEGDTVVASGFGHEKPHEGQSNDWLTPPKLLKMLGEFDLDPCASVKQASGEIWATAKTMYAPPQDGLNLPWQGRCWTNPPYGPHVDKWAQRMADHHNGILLIFLRAETEAWRKIFASGDGFLFPYRRCCFYLPDGTRAKSGTAPSALVAYGESNVECLRTCGLAGAFFRRAEITKGVKISTL